MKKPIWSMKKAASCICAMAMAFSIAAAGTAAGAVDAEELASRLRTLGMFLGVGVDADGNAVFALGRAPTRTEAIVMLVRSLGKEAQAAAYPKTHRFADVQAWADGYVSYAYDNGLTMGVSDTLFGACDAVSAEMYLTFALRALGYSDAEAGGGGVGGGGGDFSWDSPWALAAWCGILPPQSVKADFLRGDVVAITCASLHASMKGTRTPLYARLAQEGAFSEKGFLAAFPQDPFEDFRAIDRQVASYIMEREAAGPLSSNTHVLESHIITDMAQSGGSVSVAAVVGVGTAAIGEGDVVGPISSKGELWLIEMDKISKNVINCMTPRDMPADSMMEDYFSDYAIGAFAKLSDGMRGLYGMVLQEQIASGALGFRQPSYEESLRDLSAEPSLYVAQTLETEQCTILLCGRAGAPHGDSASLYLVYKPGSAVGEGTVVALPLPESGFWGASPFPDDLGLSEDGQMLAYSFHFDEGAEVDGRTVHEAETHSYTVDLATGEASGPLH